MIATTASAASFLCRAITPSENKNHDKSDDGVRSPIQAPTHRRRRHHQRQHNRLIHSLAYTIIALDPASGDSSCAAKHSGARLLPCLRAEISWSGRESFLPPRYPNPRCGSWRKLAGGGPRLVSSLNRYREESPQASRACTSPISWHSPNLVQNQLFSRVRQPRYCLAIQPGQPLRTSTSIGSRADETSSSFAAVHSHPRRQQYAK